MKGISVGTIIVVLSILGIAMAGTYISIADSIQSDNSDQGEDGTSIGLESNNSVSSEQEISTTNNDGNESDEPQIIPQIKRSGSSSSGSTSSDSFESSNEDDGDSSSPTDEDDGDSDSPTDEDNPETQEIPEFPTMALPILSIISLMLLLSRRRSD